MFALPFCAEPEFAFCVPDLISAAATAKVMHAAASTSAAPLRLFLLIRLSPLQLLVCPKKKC
jgi:hypothetical protein